MTFLYLDQAATSWPKPPVVREAMDRWFDELGVSAERGDSRRCAEVAAAVGEVRSRLARECGVPRERVAFTSGATEGLNLLLRGVLGPGARVVTTATEHSSVVRPLVALRESMGLRVEVVPCDGAGRVDPDDVRRTIGAARTRLLVVSHASNVTGAVQDVIPMLESARECGAVSLLDASQTAGVVPIDVGADLLAASAHKGLLGPPGLGFLAARPGVEPEPLKQGGTGSSRALETHPDEWPAAFEAGTPNTPALLGLGAALQWLDARDRATLREQALAVADGIAARLRERPDVRIVSPDHGARVAILSFVSTALDPAEIGALLDAADIHVRTGFHCAPWIHRHLGTRDAGTVRVSPGPFVSADAPTRVVSALGP